jgi:hypothetical protein
MPTAVETAVMRTAMMSPRIPSVTAVKTSLVSLPIMRLAVHVLALTSSCVLDRTALDKPVDQESREGFPPRAVLLALSTAAALFRSLGIWSSHEMPDQATYTRNTYDAKNNQENRGQHDPTLLLV